MKVVTIRSCLTGQVNFWEDREILKNLRDLEYTSKFETLVLAKDKDNFDEAISTRTHHYHQSINPPTVVQTQSPFSLHV